MLYKRQKRWLIVIGVAISSLWGILLSIR